MANIDSVKLPNGNEYNLQDVVTPRTAASQPNLLINPWFTVNQRGTTSGSVGTTATYIIDRWKGMRLGSYSISSSGISIAWDGVHSTFGYLSQAIEGDYLKGKTVTFSAIIDGDLVEKSFTVPSSGEVTYALNTNFELNAGSSTDSLICALRIKDANSHTIRAMKLEIGSTSTLHLDTAPDYTTELLKCQRYYYRLKGMANNSYFGPAIVAQEHYCNVDLKLPTAMRTAPTRSYSGSVYAFINSVQINFSDIELIYRVADYLTLSLYTTSSLTIGYAGIAALGNGSYIELSAEL